MTSSLPTSLVRKAWRAAVLSVAVLAAVLVATTATANAAGTSPT